MASFWHNSCCWNISLWKDFNILESTFCHIHQNMTFTFRNQRICFFVVFGLRWATSSCRTELPCGNRTRRFVNSDTQKVLISRALGSKLPPTSEATGQSPHLCDSHISAQLVLRATKAPPNAGFGRSTRTCDSVWPAQQQRRWKHMGGADAHTDNSPAPQQSVSAALSGFVMWIWMSVTILLMLIDLPPAYIMM